MLVIYVLIAAVFLSLLEIENVVLFLSLKIDTYLRKKISKFLFEQVSCVRLIVSHFQLCA